MCCFTQVSAFSAYISVQCFHSIMSMCLEQQNCLKFLCFHVDLKRGNVFEYFFKKLSQQETTHIKEVYFS